MRRSMIDRYATLPASPLAPGLSPIRVRVRETGSGAPLAILHGGWGYDMYPFDRQIAVLAVRHRIVIPDRTGYGGSGALDVQRPDFHQRAAEETLAVLDAMSIQRTAIWGHSDGAVIALRMALTAPARVSAVVVEAVHFYRRKPRSRPFFETMRDAPESFGVRVVSTLTQEHGERWRGLMATNGSAWLAIADEAPRCDTDLYEGRLGQVSCPVMTLHGGADPRTEPGELDAFLGALGPRARATHIFPEAGHSPHSERATADAVTAAVDAFLS